MLITEFLRSRKFLFTCISIVLFSIGVFVFKEGATEFATALTILFAPYLVANVAEKFKKGNNVNNDELG